MPVQVFNYFGLASLSKCPHKSLTLSHTQDPFRPPNKALRVSNSTSVCDVRHAFKGISLSRPSDPLSVCMGHASGGAIEDESFPLAESSSFFPVTENESSSSVDTVSQNSGADAPRPSPVEEDANHFFSCVDDEPDFDR